jgi:hypothetical protein
MATSLSVTLLKDKMMQKPCRHSNAQATDAFCPDCGKTFSREEPHQSFEDGYCAGCGAMFEKMDAFCPECGAARQQPDSQGTASSPNFQQQTTARTNGSSTASSNKTTQARPVAPQKPNDNNTYQTPIFDGQSYHCPKCNAVLTSGLKRCGMCSIYFMQPVPLPISRPVSQTASRSQSRMWLFIPLCILLIIGATVLYAKWHAASGNIDGRYIWVNPNRRDFYIVLQFETSGSYSVQRSFDPLVSRGTYTVRGKDITFTHHIAYDYSETFHGRREGDTVFTGMLADEDQSGKQLFGTMEFAFVRQ